ncbi:MAG: acyl carrier protein [Rhizobiaceae bacterium]
MDSFARDIIALIAGRAKIPVDEITPDTALAEIDIQSLDLAEIIFDLEEKFGIVIELNTAEATSSLSNVGDIIEAVRGLVQARA